MRPNLRNLAGLQNFRRSENLELKPEALKKEDFKIDEATGSLTINNPQIASLIDSKIKAATSGISNPIEQTAVSVGVTVDF